MLLLSGCAKTDEQRDFENEATQNEPDNITETDPNGNISSVDETDWQISPYYQGQISLGVANSQPPYPNPVNYNSTLYLQINLNVSNVVNRIEIYSFRLPEPVNHNWVTTFEQSEISTYNLFNISAASIATAEGETASGLYRLLIYDGQQNLITYGDIRIQ
jgi:hypothetical protein